MEKTDARKLKTEVQQVLRNQVIRLREAGKTYKEIGEMSKKSKSIGKKFMRLVQIVMTSTKITYPKITWDMDPISEYYAT